MTNKPTAAPTGPEVGAPGPIEQRSASTLRAHAQAALVPAIAPEAYRQLRADIERRGLQVPLEITARNVVLDGHLRLRAARELELAQLPVRLVRPPDEVEYMVLAALQRRQLTASQRAVLAVELNRYRETREQGKRRRLANLKGQTEVATLPPRGKTRELAAAWVGVSPRTIQEAITVRAADLALFEQVKQGRLAVNVAARRVKQRQRDAQLPPPPPLPDGRFELIYADPPWQLGNPDGPYAPENHYPTMPLEQIKALPVPAADDAVLYLWAVNSHLPEALAVLAAWGFEYRANEVWVKQSIGMGVWTRNRHELLLIGRRGNASPPEPERRLDSVVEADRGKHSQKPRCFYERLEQLYPDRSKLELFARGTPRPGWTAWGNEVSE